jgi:hypothetical protein
MSAPSYTPYPSGDLIKSKCAEELARRLNVNKKELEDKLYPLINASMPASCINTLFDAYHLIGLYIIEYYRSHPDELHKVAGAYEKGIGV